MSALENVRFKGAPLYYYLINILTNFSVTNGKVLEINIQKIIYISFTVEGCPSFSVTNGKVLGINTQKGSSVQVKCNDGYKLKSQEYQFRKCQDNGHWSGTGGNGAVVECLSKFPFYLFIYLFIFLPSSVTQNFNDVFKPLNRNIYLNSKFFTNRNALWCTAFNRWSEDQINRR